MFVQHSCLKTSQVWCWKTIETLKSSPFTLFTLIWRHKKMWLPTRWRTTGMYKLVEALQFVCDWDFDHEKIRSVTCRTCTVHSIIYCYVLLNRVPRSLLSFTWVSTNSWHLLTFELYIFEMWFECIVRALFGPSSWLCLTFSPLRQWLHSSRETRPGQAGQRSGCLPRTIWTLHVQCINILY